jgi:hypothetical protein
MSDIHREHRVTLSRSGPRTRASATMVEKMKLTVSDEAAHLIEERGGRLYVWVKKGCCGAVRTLATSTEAPARQEFRRIEGDERFELFLPAHLDPLPDELELDLRRYPRRVEAYWNGSAWVV